MLTFGELAWAAYIYAIVTKGDKDYWEVERHRSRIDGFVTQPWGSDLEEIEDIVVRQFLNDWGGCRIPRQKVPGIARRIARELEKLGAAERDALCALSIRDVAVGWPSDETGTRIRRLYDGIDKIDGCGPTVVSKILFILFPKLCMMWDGYIRNHLKRCQPDIRTDDGQGYLCFLRGCGGEMARSVSDDFRETLGQGDTPEDYLSPRLYPERNRKTLAKYLDEYLWTKITTIGEMADLCPPPEWLTALTHS